MNAWKKPIHRDDLLPVLRSGFFMAFTGGIAIGTLHLLFIFTLRFTLTWLFMLILSHLTAKRIARSYQTYHIAYSILSIFFFLLSYYLMSLTLNIGVYYLSDVFNFTVLIHLLNPFHYIQFLNPLSIGFFTVENILDVVFFIIGIVYSYRFSK
ncbi:MAG: hypothetical protein RBR75_00465 [Acholeplasmataceae bacterium]|nr:hypothetical protein [Acholeplasmataceae bacterium]